MDTLFSDIERYKRNANAPLAVRMRPQTLEGFVGQEAAVGEGSWLRNAIEHDVLSSVILYGPAGTGKTTLARIIANTTHAEFVEVSAVTGTVKDLRREVDAAEQRLLVGGRRTILFVDEIHRFNRSQQDALLHAVEDRIVVLVGATTENPYFEVNSALLSRSRVVELTALGDDDLATLVTNALTSEHGLAGAYTLDDDALSEIVTLAGGDGRAALTTLELASQLADDRHITSALVTEANPRHGLAYDKSGDMHYDIISAFIKSMRGSDPDAALYWLARMIDAGEDPKFIARRIFICASEDIGNADPQALLVAEAAFKATEVIGYPECRINLAQAVVYLALAPKSNAAESGIDAALAEVRSGPRREVPNHLRDRHRPGSDDYGPYLYPHNYPSGWVPQQYLPDGLERGAFYQPGPRGWEAWRVEATARDRAEAMGADGTPAPTSEQDGSPANG
ncbi:MAG: replication-associated recombination protein A [Atopobiaceae bacterium]|jgi:putative ATPase|nr:replication-associated recombination protein A [Atopobiaceae bacterium]MCH4214606.1 replication-associated recombination protein A [Atopobiaceae bacterium]MCH4230412.1 replication-associated recombination protein A [Atopobiaceae bacterium]MCH4275799.1 replication-associated recombination protein A [Atopobiaceae bacterium]MCI1225837.1 replication-associated recombination protein A [Atopobiaceae bacterium]